MSLPVDYRDYFVRNLHDALSGVYGVPEKLSLNCCGIVSAQCQLHLFMFWGILWLQDLVSVEQLAWVLFDWVKLLCTSFRRALLIIITMYFSAMSHNHYWNTFVLRSVKVVLVCNMGLSICIITEYWLYFGHLGKVHAHVDYVFRPMLNKMLFWQVTWTLKPREFDVNFVM